MKKVKSFDELAGHFPTRSRDLKKKMRDLMSKIKCPLDDVDGLAQFQINFRISSNRAHRRDENFHVNLVGFNVRYYNATRSVAVVLSILGYNATTSIHTKRNDRKKR